jgi:hypothetical protein
MDFVNGTSSYFLFYGRKPLCELATGQGMLKQALLLFLVTFEVYMVDVPEEYYGKIFIWINYSKGFLCRSGKFTSTCCIR